MHLELALRCSCLDNFNATLLLYVFFLIFQARPAFVPIEYFKQYACRLAVHAAKMHECEVFCRTLS